MIQNISSWAGSIVVAVIIAGILEMLIIDGNNKKYIKAVIGLYIVFTIISPVVKNFADNNFRIEAEKILQGDSYDVSSDKLNLDGDINKIYNSSLEADIKSRLIEKGYNAVSVDVQVDSENQKINKLVLVVEKDKSKVSDVNIEPVKTIGIQPIDKRQEEEKGTNTEEMEKLKEYISDIYGIGKEQIVITE